MSTRSDSEKVDECVRKKSRKLDDDGADDEPPRKLPAIGLEEVGAPDSEHGRIVAEHYNQLEERGLQERYNSPIFYMRNFNNWVKSVLIQEFTDKIRGAEWSRKLRVLDVCCGKGGDLSKWQKARVDHAIFADIAAVSVQQCETRFEDLRRRARGRLFSAEFIVADCAAEGLRERYRDPSVRLDLASCQFGFHYSFESLPRARRMLRNISECLGPGAYFIGTMPDANEIIRRCRKSEDNSFGNRIFNIKLMFDPEKDGYPLFGGKYDFHLEGVVDCPEFLVHWGTLVRLARQFGLEPVYRARFSEFFVEHQEKYHSLLHKIKCLESWPAPEGRSQLAPKDEYEQAHSHRAASSESASPTLGTMSRAEWEATTIYMAFAFKKMKSTLDSEGRPVYEVEHAPEPT